MRLVAEHRGECKTGYAAIRSIAVKLGIATPETMRQWIRKAEAEVHAGEQRGVPSTEPPTTLETDLNRWLDPIA